VKKRSRTFVLGIFASGDDYTIRVRYHGNPIWGNRQIRQ
jgi:hypothetical protein